MGDVVFAADERIIVVAEDDERLLGNRGVLGHLRDDPGALRRAADYLENPPAARVLTRKAK